MSAQNVRVVVRLPYNRPANHEDQIADPPRVEWGPEKADILWKVIEKSRTSDSGGADWKGLAAHLEVPLPYLLYRVHARYQEDLRGLQDIPGVSSPISPNVPFGGPFGEPSTDQQTPNLPGRTLSRLIIGGSHARLSPSLGRGSTPLGIRARLNSIGHRDSSSSSSLRPRKGTASSSTLTLQTPVARKPIHHLPIERPASPASSEEDEMDSDDDEMLKEEESERDAEEQEALDRKLADLQKMMTGEKLGLVSVGKKQGRQVAKQSREYDRGRSDLSASAALNRSIHQHNHHYNASLSSQSNSASVSSAGSPQGSLPEIPSPTADSLPHSPESRSPLRRHMSPTKSSSPPALSPRSALGQSHRMFGPGAHDRDGSEASTGSFSDISDASLSASALDSALLSANIRGTGSRLSAYARSRFGTSYRTTGTPH
ncbi:hypothetical protein BT96DRAFT_916574 [Gymnopus androsaceus JB14]|uniref:Autophagy-related protein 29 n=1 Tax=Gymnopus androsaceus JB14 TaxID=1447944 RepID=A0A6A4I2D8_9AGAR|nr:hypothetical protein BT96DRAFT_916574 [Gymnopus androsaceus JB14]